MLKIIYMNTILQRLGFLALVFVAPMQWSGLSFAQTIDNATELYQSSLASTCANCHGTDGKGVINGGIPLINHLNSEQMLKELKGYKSGTREGTIMPQLMRGYSDTQLEILSQQLGKKE